MSEASKIAGDTANQTIQHLNDLGQITLEKTNYTLNQLNDTINRITENVVTQTNDTVDQINEWLKEKYGPSTRVLCHRIEVPIAIQK